MAREPIRKNNIPSPDLVKVTPATRFYRCCAKDCPTPNVLLKMKRNKPGRPPLYHADCRAAIDKIRKSRTHPDSTRGSITTDRGPASLEEAKLSGEKCGAERRPNSFRGPGPCCLPRGWGTDHPGFGHCKFHSGNTPSGQVAAVKEMMFKDMQVLGTPIAVDPHEGVLQEIHRTAGHIEWIRLMLAAIGTDPLADHAEDVEELTGFIPEGARNALMQFSEKGKDLSVWMQLYQSERTHFVRTCKMAVDMGCAERAVQVAEDQGKAVALVIMRVINHPDLALTNAQKVKVPEIVRTELMALSENSKVLEASAVAS